MDFVTEQRSKAHNCANPSKSLQGQNTGENAPPEIDVFMDRLYVGTEALSARLAGLEGRLRSVLRCAPPSEEAIQRLALTPLGEKLAGLGVQIELLIQAVDSISSRLEI